MIRRSHRDDARHPERLPQDQELRSHPRRIDPHVVRQLVAQRADGKGEDIAHEKRQHRLLRGEHAGVLQGTGCGKADCKWCGGIYKLMDAVDNYIPTPTRPKDQPFLMAVEDVFSIAKRGTVVTGKIEKGTLKVGDEVMIRGSNGERKTVVAGLEMFRKIVNQASLGDNVGILFKELSKQDVQRGDLILGPTSDFTWKP